MNKIYESARDEIRKQIDYGGECLEAHQLYEERLSLRQMIYAKCSHCIEENKNSLQVGCEPRLQNSDLCSLSPLSPFRMRMKNK